MRPKHIVENNRIIFFGFIAILIVKKAKRGRNVLGIKVLNSYVFSQLTQTKPDKRVIRKHCFKGRNLVSTDMT